MGNVSTGNGNDINSLCLFHVFFNMEELKNSVII